MQPETVGVSGLAPVETVAPAAEAALEAAAGGDPTAAPPQDAAGEPAAEPEPATAE